MKEKILTLLKAMTVGSFEREEVTSLSLLASLSGESIFLLGLPGVGKSMIARKLKTAFLNAKSFEYLMSRFSTPDEIFGPVSISKLKDEDRYERITTGYLPEAEVIFLDEIWKAGPAIQNSLLTVLNERIYLNGNREILLPVKAIIAASNELPAEGECLEALWDRFLLRYVVEPLKDKRNFSALVSGMSDKSDVHPTPLTHSELEEIREGSRRVEIADSIIDILYGIRERMNKKMEKYVLETAEESEGEIDMKFYVSDRRWKKAVGIMKTSAFLNDRQYVDFSDLLLLRHILWNDSNEINDVDNMLSEEIVSSIFKNLLSKQKNPNRHATRIKTASYYSPDKRNYVIQCDGFQLKIAIEDYNHLKKTGMYALASETSDEVLQLREHGQYAIQFFKEGFISINSFSYPLVTETDRQMSEKFLMEVCDTLETIVLKLNQSIKSNLFVKDSKANENFFHIVKLYQQRLEKC